MNKEEFIKYVIANNYRYYETKEEINIDKIVDNLENIDKSITYYKDDKEISLWLSESGSGTEHILDEFEINVIKYLGLLDKEVK